MFLWRKWNPLPSFFLAFVLFALFLYMMGTHPLGLLASGGGMAIGLLVLAFLALLAMLAGRRGIR